jgi:hypothetical protein
MNEFSSKEEPKAQSSPEGVRLLQLEGSAAYTQAALVALERAKDPDLDDQERLALLMEASANASLISVAQANDEEKAKLEQFRRRDEDSLAGER